MIKELLSKFHRKTHRVNMHLSYEPNESISMHFNVHNQNQLKVIIRFLRYIELFLLEDEQLLTTVLYVPSGLFVPEQFMRKVCYKYLGKAYSLYELKRHTWVLVLYNM